MKHILYSLHVSGRSHQEPAPLCKGCSVLPSLSYHLPHRPCWDHLPNELPVLEVSPRGAIWGQVNHAKTVWVFEGKCNQCTELRRRLSAVEAKRPNELKRAALNYTGYVVCCSP